MMLVARHVHRFGAIEVQVWVIVDIRDQRPDVKDGEASTGVAWATNASNGV